MADLSVLEVLLYEAPIGTLTRVSGDQTLFAFDEAYIADAGRPVDGDDDHQDDPARRENALLPEKLVLDTVRETVALFHQNWQTEKANLPLHADVIKTIEAHVKTIPLYKNK